MDNLARGTWLNPNPLGGFTKTNAALDVKGVTSDEKITRAAPGVIRKIGPGDYFPHFVSKYFTLVC